MISSDQEQMNPNARALVISLPKSGTYLMGAILKNLGLADSKMHLVENGHSDYEGATIDEARLHPKRFSCAMPLSESLKRIPHRGFAVGHLPFSNESVQATSGVRRIFLIRELRHALVSYMRFVHSTRRFGAAEHPWFASSDPRERMAGFLDAFGALFYEKLFQPMLGWQDVDETLTVRFEDLIGPTNRSHLVIDAVAAHVNASSYNAGEVLRAGLATETMTKSPQLSSLDHFWSEAAEQRFVALSYSTLNEKLGYDVQYKKQRRSVA